MQKTICLLPGDGIGPEIVAEAVKVLRAVEKKFGHSFTMTEALLGGAAIDAVGVPLPDATVEACKAAGHRVALATNPIFPAVATESRIRWAGLAPETFAWYTTYENIGYCKPNPDYYREILRYLGDFETVWKEAGAVHDGGQRCGGGYDGRPGGGAVGLSAHRLPAQPEREGHLLLSPGGF